MYSFETKRLQMRPFTKDEKNEFVNICLDEEVKKYFDIGTNPNDIAAFFDDSCLNCTELDTIFAIHNKEEKVVGFISYYTFPPDSITIEYVINKKYRKNGYAKEALSGLLQYVKSINCKINSANFAIKSDNVASLNVINRYNPIPDSPFGTHSFFFLKNSFISTKNIGRFV